MNSDISQMSESDLFAKDESKGYISKKWQVDTEKKNQNQSDLSIERRRITYRV